MAVDSIAIVSRGPFSWPAAVASLSTFLPTEHHGRGTTDILRLTFPLDGDFTPVAVGLREEAGQLVGEVAGTN